MDRLLAVVYDQLRALAQDKLAQEAPGHSLQATALVHEAYLRLISRRDAPWEDRAGFFAAAAQAMRRILVDHARARGRVKRGGPNGWKRREPLSGLSAEPRSGVDLVALDEAMASLRQSDPSSAKVVDLRFFAGMEEREIAAVMGTSERTVRRQWTYARAWLFRAMGEPAGHEEEPE